MPKYNDENSSGFEKFSKKPKNYKKGKNNRSNKKQILKDTFTTAQNSDSYLDDRFMDNMEEWEQ
jgi:hypothetical protein